MKPRDFVYSKTLRRSFGTAAALGLLGGGASAALVSGVTGSTTWGTVLLAFLLGAGAFSIPVATGGVLLHWVREFDREQRGLVQVRPLSGRLPLPLGDVAIDARFAALLVDTIRRLRPRLTVECGSGSSTVLGAACLRELGAGRIVSLEHHAEYAEHTRSLLREHGLEEWAEVVTAPLREWEVNGGKMPWYGADPEQFAYPGIDLLVVDGPPRTIGPSARYPAMPLLRPYLSPDCVLLLDDGNRSDECAVALRWAAELPATAKHDPSGKGAWLLHRIGHEQP